MNLVRRAASLPSAGGGMSLSDFDRIMDFGAFGAPTYTGKSLSHTGSLQVDAVWACVDALSGDLASAPLWPYRRTGEFLASGKFARELAVDHYLFPVLTHQANSEMTAWRFKQLMMVWLCLWGNAYAEIEINGRGQVTALWPWRPDRVKVSRDQSNGPLVYSYRMNGGQVVAVPAERMLHLRGLSVDGVMGLSPIETHKQNIALSQAMTEHTARFFGNGARPLGVLTHPGRLSREGGPEEVRKNWEMVHGGLQNSHRIAILQEGMTYKEVGLNMVASQCMELQGLSVTGIARIFGVPPHRIADLSRSTNNNIEHQGLEYVQYGIGKWGANWGNELAFSLLSPRESESVFIEFDFRHLLRGDLVAQAQWTTAMINSGTLVQDEVREDIGYNPLPNGWGAKPWKPLNAGYAGDPPPAQPSRQGMPTPVDHPAKVNGLAH